MPVKKKTRAELEEALAKEKAAQEKYHGKAKGACKAFWILLVIGILFAAGVVLSIKVGGVQFSDILALLATPAAAFSGGGIWIIVALICAYIASLLWSLAFGIFLILWIIFGAVSSHLKGNVKKAQAELDAAPEENQYANGIYPPQPPRYILAPAYPAPSYPSLPRAYHHKDDEEVVRGGFTKREIRRLIYHYTDLHDHGKMSDEQYEKVTRDLIGRLHEDDD